MKKAKIIFLCYLISFVGLTVLYFNKKPPESYTHKSLKCMKVIDKMVIRTQLFLILEYNNHACELDVTPATYATLSKGQTVCFNVSEEKLGIPEPGGVMSFATYAMGLLGLTMILLAIISSALL